MIIHEPPLIGLLKDNPDTRETLQIVNERIKTVLDLIAAGKTEKAAEEFVEKIALGPGSWEILPDDVKKIFINNAHTWYDEMQDPRSLEIDLKTLSDFKRPALLTAGTESPPFFPMIINKLMTAIPHAKRITIEGAGHVPHMSHSEKYIELVNSFCFAEAAI